MHATEPPRPAAYCSSASNATYVEGCAFPWESSWESDEAITKRQLITTLVVYSSLGK